MEVEEDEIASDSEGILELTEKCATVVALSEVAIASNSDNSEPAAISGAETNPPHLQKGITATVLAQRLGLKAVSTITRRPEDESEEKFKGWTKKRDPHGVAWVRRESSDHNKRTKVLYFPCTDHTRVRCDRTERFYCEPATELFK